jgi:hypothetical protein
MSDNFLSTLELIKIIGSPFVDFNRRELTNEKMLEIYPRAFEDRVAPLFLSLYRSSSWSSELEEKYEALLFRQKMTRLSRSIWRRTSTKFARMAT